MSRKICRRRFVKTAITTTATVAVAPGMSFDFHPGTFDPKGLPTRRLGKTGVQVPLLGMGCGSRWMSIEDDDKALEILEYALDHGIYYWDTSTTYRNDEISSEERIGKLLKSRRKEVFMVTKVRERTADKAKESIEKSLKRLQTDYIDLMHVHAIESMEDAENLGKDGQILEVLHDYRDQGIIRHFGFTGHSSSEAMKRVAELYDFEVMMIALNHHRNLPFEENALPFAVKKGIGVVAMKVIRPRETIDGLSPDMLIRYALSFKDFALANISNSKLNDLKENLETIRDFKPLDAEEMKKMQTALGPYFRHDNLAWMEPGYFDGGIEPHGLGLMA